MLVLVSHPINKRTAGAPVVRGVSVKVLRAVGELEQIRESWESWPGHGETEMHAYLAFLHSNPQTIRPHVLTIDREGRPDAILTGRIDLGHLSCRLGYAQLRLPARILCFGYGALRGNASEENCELLVRCILRCLSDGEADVAYLNFLKVDSELYRLAMKMPRWLSRDYIHSSQPHFVALLPASAGEFYSGLSSGARWQLKSKQKKLLKSTNGDVRVRCFKDPSELDAMIRDVEEIARKSYQRGLGVGFADTSEILERLRFQAERSSLRAYVLYLGGRPCSFWIGDINHDTFGSCYLGYDPEFGQYSPGTFLMTRVLEGFCDENRDGVTSVDFGLGSAQYKQMLSNQTWLEAAVYIFAPSLRGVALNLTKTAIGATDHTLKNVLSRIGLLQKVKKSWRDRARRA